MEVALAPVELFLRRVKFVLMPSGMGYRTELKKPLVLYINRSVCFRSPR